MKRYTIKIFVVMACLTLVSLPLPVTAQTGELGLSITASPTTVSRGGYVGISAKVTNNTSKRMRVTVTIKSFSPCGDETMLSANRVALEPGRSVFLSVPYPIAADACMGMYSLTVSGDLGKGSGSNASAATSSATAYVTVQ